MAMHDLKTWPESFFAVKCGEKTLEIRLDDRGFAVGDTLRLRLYDPAQARFLGDMVDRTVTHILPGGQFGLEPGYVALSLGEADLIEEVIGRAEQACRYVEKHQNWEDDGEGNRYRDGFEVACAVCEEAIRPHVERHIGARNRNPKAPPVSASAASAEAVAERQAMDDAPGYPDRRPIVDWTGVREHRGRATPVAGCGCICCFSATLLWRAK